MQLVPKILLAVTLAGVFVTSVSAQSVSPLRKEGNTLTNKKAFYVNVGNPYESPMTFSLRAMETDFETPAESVVVSPNRIKLGVNRTKRVIIMFAIPEGEKERKVALCVEPEGITGTVQPRVCGTYTGKRLGK